MEDDSEELVQDGVATLGRKDLDGYENWLATLIETTTVNVFLGDVEVGYLTWQAAQALGPEMDAGLSLEASVVGLDGHVRRVRIAIAASESL